MPLSELRSALLSLGILALLGCAPRTAALDPAAAADGGPEITIVLDASLRDLGARRVAWQYYAVLKAKVIEQKPGLRDDYWIEVATRSALAKHWEEERIKVGGEADAYLDALVQVERSDHMKEYVLASLARPGWTIPGDMVDELDLEGFLAWSRENLPGHQVVTLGGVQRGDSDLRPPVPGDDLPTFEDLVKDGSPCAELPRAAAAYAGWRQREAQLPGLALASRDRNGFLAGIALLRATPAARGRDVTWVSPKAADVSYLVGYCEVDRNQRPASVDALETAVRLNPLAPMWRVELVGSLTAAKRFDDAAREIDRVLAQTDDRCTLGAAWRKKGFLEIERGELDQAELSYRKSLDYEPGNDIALSELKIILQERMRRGDGPPVPYTPPPSTAPMQRSCTGR